MSWLQAPAIAPLTGALPDRSMSQPDALAAVAERWRRYEASGIDRTIAPVDDMLAPGGEAHYFGVGRSALTVIGEAMVLARRAGFASILDMPCGGGRVTRHLVRFFPDAEVWVSDVERHKQAAVVAQFGVHGADFDAALTAPTVRPFDLIFVGSLLTHFDEAQFRRAFDFFVRALAPGGVLVATLHGRHMATILAASGGPNRRALARDYARAGFGYYEVDRTRYGGVSYGITLTAPSWVTRLVEARGDIVLLGLKERAWDSSHDVLVVQKLA